MRVVVTGASGFIGRNICRSAPPDWDIVALYHRATDFASWVRAAGLTRVRPVACDLTSAEDTARLAGSLGPLPDAALYLAANGDPSRSVVDPRDDLEANTLALVNFLEHVHVPHLVYVSSGAVYEGLEGPVSPQAVVNPHLPYAISKLAAERYVHFFAARRGAPASYAVVRFFGAYGPFEPPRKITTRWLRAIHAGERTFTLRGDGKNLIDFMYVDDAVEGFVRLVETRGERRVLDFAVGEPRTLDELVAAMERALDVRVDLRHEGGTAEYHRFRSADPTMRTRYGFVPRVSLDDGLRRLSATLLTSRDASASLA
jgi:nucleoside-diphosphate-sugar epimerase